nr:ribonuclease H-like domain-containing protein [Tanacetum cinerariifolium]
MRLKSRVQNPLVDATFTSPMVLLAKSNTSARRGPSLEKVNNPCWSFAKGSCRFGDACKYLHNGVHGKSTLLPHTSSSALSVPDVTRSDLDMLQSLLAKFGLNAPNTSTPSPPLAYMVSVPLGFLSISAQLSGQPTYQQGGSFPGSVHLGQSPSMPFHLSQLFASGSQGSGQATLLPNEFNTTTLQDPAFGNWNMDTGASSHLNDSVHYLSDILNMCIYPSIAVGDGHFIPVTNSSHSVLSTLFRPLRLNNVLITPNIVKNLISVRQFVHDNSCTVEFDPFGFSVKDFITRRVLLRCGSTCDLHPVTKPSTIPDAFLTKKLPILCHACQLGKHVKLLFVSSSSSVTSCFNIIHSDLWTSPVLSLSVKSSLFSVVMVVNLIIMLFINYFTITIFNLDFLALAPHKNGKSERMIRTMNNLIRTLLFQAHLPPNYWTEVLNMAVYLLNILPSRAINNEIRFTRLFVFPFPSTKSTTIPYDFLDDSTDLISKIIRTSPITPVLAPVHTLQVDVPTPPTPHTPPPPPTPQSVPQIIPEHAPAPANDSPTMSIHPMVTCSRVGTTHPNPLYVGHVSTIFPLPRSSVPRPEGANIIRCMWLFRHKFLADGTFSRYKARLVANGSTQRKYAMEILERAHIVGYNPSRTPVDTESKLGDGGTSVVDPTLYRSLAGSLQYLTFTRPDIKYVVQQGTLDYGLQLFSSTTDSLIAYSDANWAGCPTTRRSTLGYCVFLGNNLLLWSFKRQQTLSRSSAEAGYRVQHQRTKHIEIDIHFFRALVTTGQVRVLHVPSRFQDSKVQILKSEVVYNNSAAPLVATFSAKGRSRFMPDIIKTCPLGTLDVAWGHGGDGGDDDRPPPYQIPTSCGGCLGNRG